MPEERPRVFVSYSHDSPEHAASVRSLADQLIGDGLDCEVDQYHVSPPEGWPRWMLDQLEGARFVLMICTEPYGKKVLGREVEGVGLGATWEGAIITQQLYEDGGRNSKFIPIVFHRDDIVFIPHFVAGVTRYNLSEGTAYDALYRHLTNQPRVLKPALGQMRIMEPDEPSASTTGITEAPKDDLVLLLSQEAGLYAIAADRIEQATDLELTLRIESPSQSTFLESLARLHDRTMGVAFGHTASLVKYKSARRTVVADQETWSVAFETIESDYGAGFMEMGTTTLSVDRIAELRARRILLDERLQPSGSTREMEINDAFVSALVGGINTPMRVQDSPLPDLWETHKGNPQLFLATARLVTAMWLRLTGVTQSIENLDLRLDGAQLQVTFAGTRPRRYTNQEPAKIRVDGVCPLDRGDASGLERGEEPPPAQARSP